MLYIIVTIITFILCLITGSLFFYLFFLLPLINTLVKIHDRRVSFERVPTILLMFENSKEIVYENVYREHIYQHIVSGFKITSDELPELQDIFIKQMKLYLGPNIWNDLEFIKGDTDSIVYELMLYFLNKLIDNEHLTSAYDIEDGEEEFINDLNSGKMI